MAWRCTFGSRWHPSGTGGGELWNADRNERNRVQATRCGDEAGRDPGVGRFYQSTAGRNWHHFFSPANLRLAAEGKSFNPGRSVLKKQKMPLSLAAFMLQRTNRCVDAIE